MELFRFSLKKFLSSDGILVYLLMALRCGISRLRATNLLNFCYIQKFSKPFLFTSHRNILNPKLESVKAPAESTVSGVTYTITIVIKGLNGEIKKQDLLFLFMNPKAIAYDDLNGVFVLNEGNMTTENGSLTYITPDGFVIDDAYKAVNGTELGNVCQDMAFYNGKIYIISQNGDENAVGTKFENDGMLVVIDAKTLKKEKAFSKSELAGLDWPTHIAVLDESHVYIRDNKGIYRFDTNTKKLTFIDGSDGAPKSKFVVMDGKVYTIIDSSF